MTLRFRILFNYVLKKITTIGFVEKKSSFEICTSEFSDFRQFGDFWRILLKMENLLKVYLESAMWWDAKTFGYRLVML